MRALAIVFKSADPDRNASAPKSQALEPKESSQYMQCARIAESCLHLGTTVALYPGVPGDSTPGGSTPGGSTRVTKDAHSAVCLDITGCARLFGKTSEEGESAIAKEAEARVNALGIPCRVAIADGARVARAVAWLGREARVIVSHGQAKAAMSALPLAALSLPDKTCAWLSRLGIARVSELLALPRKELGSRLGASEKDVFSLAEGEDRAPLVPYVPPSVPEESVDLDVGIDSHEALAFVLKMLAARMSARLVGRGKAIAKMELVLSLDVAALTASKRERVARNAGFSGEDAGAARRTLHTEQIALPAPLSIEKDLLVVLRAKMERQQLEAPIRGVTLRATELVEKPARALSLFSSLPRAEGVLARLAGELFAEGFDVGELGLADTWDPAKRSILICLGSQEKRIQKKQEPSIPSVFEPAPEPTLLIEAPVTVDRKDVKQVRYLSRVECIHWWRDERIAVDRIMSKVGDVLASVEVDRMTGAANVTGYFD